MLFDTKTNKACCVLNFEQGQETQLMAKIQKLSQLGLIYFAIIHDKDFTKDFDGTIIYKTIHIHLVLQRETRCMVKWFFKRVCTYLDLKEEQVSIMPCDNIFASVQYLIHKNDEDKHPYEPFLIETNLSSKELQNYLDYDFKSQELTFDYLKDLCIQTSCSTLEIMRIIGIGRYQAYRNTIKDFIEMYRGEYAKNLTKNAMQEVLDNKDSI